MSPDSDRGAAPRRPRTPASFGALVNRSRAIPDDPKAGQIWRARWRSTAQLVALTDVEDSETRAVPVSFDVALADDRGVPLPSYVILGQETVAWMSLSFRLPVRVLDVLIGYVDPAVFSNDGIGVPIVDPLDERSQVSEVLSDRMEVLEEAAWAPVGTEAAVDIGETMRARAHPESSCAADQGRCRRSDRLGARGQNGYSRSGNEACTDSRCGS